MSRTFNRFRLFVQPRLTRFRGTLHRFERDESGSYLIIAALLLPALIGVIGLGPGGGLWYMRHNKMQHTADSAAISAATEYYLNRKPETLALQAQSVSATYGFVHNADGVKVTVNQPPTSGPYATHQRAVEVLISEPQT